MRGSELERLYDGHAQALYAFLLNLTRDETDTRDLLQDVFIKLARGPDRLAGVRDERAAAHLKLWDGLTLEQIAGALDIPLNTAASRYRYALDKLRGRLRPIYEEIKS